VPTRVATIINAMETAETIEEQKSVQAEAVTDGFFRKVLRMTYDPFDDYGRTGHPLTARIDAPDKIDEIIEGEWDSMAALLNAVRGSIPDDPDLVPLLENSKCWPVYERILMKHFHHIEIEAVNSVWGDIPTFEPGRYGEEYEDFETPMFLEPMPVGTRRLFMIVDPYREEFPSPVRAFTPEGVVHYHDEKDIAEALSTFRWEVWLGSAPEYKAGLMLDGVVTNASFGIFDYVPLKKFRTQTPAGTMMERVNGLAALADMLEKGEAFHVKLPHLCKDIGTLDHARRYYEVEVNTGDLAGLSMKHPNGSYPYHNGDAWTWLRKPEGW